MVRSGFENLKQVTSTSFRQNYNQKEIPGFLLRLNKRRLIRKCTESNVFISEYFLKIELYKIPESKTFHRFLNTAFDSKMFPEQIGGGLFLKQI